MTGRPFESFSLSEYLDVIWAMMLRDGRGGMIDYPKYRDSLTDIVWKGEVPERSAEERTRATKDMIGKAPPVSAMDEARALRERMNAPKGAEND